MIVASFGVLRRGRPRALLAGRRPRRRREQGRSPSTATPRCCSTASARSGGAALTRPPEGHREAEAAPESTQPVGSSAPMTIPRVAEMKSNGEPIVMVTAYDFPSAQVAEEAGVDIVLVGDTAAMVVLGHDATTPVGMDEMLMLTPAVRRGLKTPLLIGDMPFGSYEASNEHAIENAQRFVKEAGVRRRQARARRRLGRPRPGDHPLRHPGDGPRRPHPADRDRSSAASRPRAAPPRRRRSSPRTPWRCSRSAASRSSSRRSPPRSPRR